MHMHQPIVMDQRAQKTYSTEWLENLVSNNTSIKKMLVNGDFNATTEIATKQCFFDGQDLVSDSVCNDNGTRLKQFCLERQLCMSQTFFKHDLQDRYTWFNGDMSVKKVLDFILVDGYTQKFMKECKVDKSVKL